MRIVKGLSRQAVADALNISLANYGYIERGEIDVSITRLAEIAEIFEMTLEELVGITEKNVFHFSGMHNKEFHNWKVNFSASEEKDFEHELEKMKLLFQFQEKENENLRKQIVQLEEINRLLKGEK